MSALLIVTIKCERCPRHLNVRFPEAVLGTSRSPVALLAETRINLRRTSGWTKTPDGDFCPEHAPK